MSEQTKLLVVAGVVLVLGYLFLKRGKLVAAAPANPSTGGGAGAGAFPPLAGNMGPSGGSDWNGQQAGQLAAGLGAGLGSLFTGIGNLVDSTSNGSTSSTGSDSSGSSDDGLND